MSYRRFEPAHSSSPNRLNQGGVAAAVPAEPSKTATNGPAWRGILIALIVLGHNRLFEAHLYGAYRLLYNVHVEAFLIIPFLRRVDPDRSIDWLYALKAYWRPFCVFVTAYAVLFALSGIADAPRSVGDALTRYGYALSVASSASLDRATGFEMFWFLPVFIILATARPLIERALGAWFVAALAGAGAIHATIGYVDAATAASLPCGLPIAGYMLFPCLLAAALAKSGAARAVPIWAVGGVFIAMTGLCWLNRYWINLSDFKVYDAGRPVALLVTDIGMIAASVALLRAAAHIRARWLDAIGGYSLQIYLIHGIIGYALVRLAGRDHDLAASMALLAITYITTLALSFFAARALMRTSAGRWIFSAR